MTTKKLRTFRLSQYALQSDTPLFDLLRQTLLLLIAALISAVGVIVFLVPSQIAPGGLSGLAIIVNAVVGAPVGITMLLLNIPVLVIGYYMLGGWRVIAGTVIFVLVLSLLIDVLTPYFPPDGVSDNHLLNAIFAGVLSGISGGMTFRMGITAGGTAVLIRILNRYFGTPISTGTLYTDGLIVGLSGLVFGWEAMLFAIISIVAYGMMTDYVLEGPSLIRTATIITDKPQEVSEAVLYGLQRGVTGWGAEGKYSQRERHVLFVTVLRSQVVPLRQIVSEADPNAFVVIGQGHVAYGNGFKKVDPKRRKKAV